MAENSFGNAFSLFSAEEQPPAVLLAFLPEDCEPTADGVFSSVERQFEQELSGYEVQETSVPGATWEVEIRVKSGAVYIIWMGSFDNTQFENVDHRFVTLGEDKKLKKSSRVLGLATLMRDDYLGRLKDCYRLLSVAAPEAVAFADLGTSIIRGARWARDMAFSCALPSISLLCNIHRVKDGEGKIWLHTHGLRRCAIPEIEIFEANDESVEECSSLVERVVRRFLDLGLPPEDEAFAVGKGLEVIWLSRETLKEDWAAQLRKDNHTVPSLVLFSSIGGTDWRRLESPALSADFLQSDLFVPKAEVQSRRLLAYERFNRFRTLYSAYSQREDWSFFVFVGLVDEGPIDDANQFAWLFVDKLTERGFLAREVDKLESPAGDDSKEAYHYELHFMVDWLITCPEGLFSAADVSMLEDYLAETSPGKKRDAS